MRRSIPKVAVGLPVFNGENFVSQAIESVLGQTFTDFELIISDNGSTDATPEICRNYARRDPRIRYERSEHNVGAAANFNRVFHLSRSPYFKWAADDDVIAPTYLERAVQELDADPSVVLAFPQALLINADNSLLPFAPDRNAFIDSSGRPWYGRFLPIPALEAVDPIVRFRSILLDVQWCLEVFGLMRSDALRQTSLIGSFFGSDKVLLAELSLLGRFSRIEESLFHRRCHTKQSTALTPREQAQWISGRRPGLFVLPQTHSMSGYLNALQTAPLSMRDRLRGYAAVARLATHPKKLKRLFVPGPYNYFGFGARKKRAPSQPLPPSPAPSPTKKTVDIRPIIELSK
jgi:hypothetical protein